MSRRLKRDCCAVALLLLGAGLTGCGGTAATGGSSFAADSADPAVQDFPIAYVKRPVLLDDQGNLQTSAVRSAAEFRPGAELFVRDRASPSAAEVSITAGIFPDDADGRLQG